MNPANFKELAEQIAISVRHLRYLLEQIEWHIPKATVWAFGSRIKWSHRPESDLDLAVHCDKETARKALPKLNYALDESNLPFKVQIADFNRLPENMQANIKKNYVVLYQPQEIPLPSGWKETTLGEVAEITSSKRIFAEEYLTEGIPFYRGKEIIEKYNGNEVSTELFISHKKYNEIKENFGVPQAGEMLLTSVGTLGIPYLVNEKEEFYFKDGNLTWFKNFKDIENTFLYYWIISDLGKEQLAKHTIGSTQQALTIVGLKSISILLPPLPEQKAIAAILSSFDDKIELLWRQNNTLEAITQTIFKEWFVSFTVNGKKLKVNSKTGLPEGWRTGKLPDVFEINPVRKLKKGELAPYLDMKGVPTQGHRAEGWYNREFIAGSKFANGDTLLARITPCLENGKTAFVDFLDDEETGWGSTEFIVLRPKTPLPPFYGYLLARSEAFRSFAIGQMTGSSGRQRVPEDSLSNYEVVIPSDDVVIRFGELIEPIAQRLTLNGKESQTLSKLRDALLPKLMKGEIKVKL